MIELLDLQDDIANIQALNRALAMAAERIEREAATALTTLANVIAVKLDELMAAVEALDKGTETDTGGTP